MMNQKRETKAESRESIKATISAKFHMKTLYRNNGSGNIQRKKL